MRLIEILCVLLISIFLASFTGCLAEDSSVSTDVNPDLPRAVLPDGFSLLAALPEMDANVNLTDYITEFYGEKSIEPVNISVGIYQWEAIEGEQSYDAKVTYIRMNDVVQADNAIYNFKSQEDYTDQIARGLDIFGNAVINGHEALEVRHIRNSNSNKFMYLWNNEDLVVFVEGNSDRNQSLQLASATGL